VRNSSTRLWQPSGLILLLLLLMMLSGSVAVAGPQLADPTITAAVERAAKAVTMKRAGAPDDPGYAQQWALPKIGWDQAYGVVSVAGSATIAVLDTGVDASHPDLARRVVAGYSSLDGSGPSVDPNGHGTALAGIATATANNGAGIAGVAYSGASISSVQVLGADGTGLDADVVDGVLWAADHGASVILMGFSSADYSAALADALDYASSKGVVLVAAAGNDGTSRRAVEPRRTGTLSPSWATSSRPAAW
jgi:subtilisin family serine protease